MDIKIKDLVQLAHDHGKLKNEYEQAARGYVDQAEPLASEEFWPLVGELAQALVKAKGKSDMPSSKKVIEEFVRSRLFDARARRDPWNRDDKQDSNEMLVVWEKLASFTKAYGKTKNVIYKLCDKFADLDMSDDTFGDFCDAFVLAGPEMIERIKVGDIATMNQLRKATDDHPLQRFMLRGENYMEMFLGEFLAEKLPGVARDVMRLVRWGEPLKECQTPGVVEGMDLKAIVDALVPVTEKTTRPFPGHVQVNLTTAEHEALVKVAQMLQLADLVNYKRAQDSYPRLLQALKLVLAIADHPEQNPTEKISLATKTRAQLDSALKFAEK